MNMFLNGIELPGLVIANDVSFSGLRTTASETLSGRKVIWEQPTNGGRTLDLMGGSDYGWMTRATLQSLGALAAVVGASYTLTLSDSSTITVRFRNEDGAIDGTPLVPRPNPEDSDIYNNITIRLMEV
jgi:hypothetical protein